MRGKDLEEKLGAFQEGLANLIFYTQYGGRDHWNAYCSAILALKHFFHLFYIQILTK